MRALLVSAFVITYNDFSEQEEYKAMLLGCKNARGLVILLADVGRNKEALGCSAY